MNKISAVRYGGTRFVASGRVFQQPLYILRCIEHPDQRYIGLTDDVDRRFAEHNSGHSLHTSKFRPWKLDVIIGFAEKSKAIAFERYLKSGSGFAFARKHF